MDMQKIQEATASEPMSLDEEYENQASWRQASDKLTFIVCKPSNLGAHVVQARTADADARMVGDINFFLHPYEGDEEEGSGEDQSRWLTGEVDVMIAEYDCRGKGMGKASVCALLVYIQRHLDAILDEFASSQDSAAATAATPPELKDLMVKIKEGNFESRALFGKLGFEQRSEVNYFGEVTMGLDMAALAGQAWWEAASVDYTEARYEVT
jgi:methionyl-tRNA synthetase